MIPGDLLLHLFCAFVVTVGFGILFNIPHKMLVLCGTIGAIGHLLHYILRISGVSNEVATFIGALFVGLAGYWQARRIHAPRLAFTLTGIITMIPGIPAYEMVVFFSNNQLIEGLQRGVRVGLLVGAITAGLSAARFITEIEYRKP
jgi:uncharacterized membrane protein YjjB (DUF3815 family)